MSFYVNQFKKAAEKNPELYENELKNIKPGKWGSKVYRKSPLWMYFDKIKCKKI